MKNTKNLEKKLKNNGQLIAEHDVYSNLYNDAYEGTDYYYEMNGRYYCISHRRNGMEYMGPALSSFVWDSREDFEAAARGFAIPIDVVKEVLGKDFAATIF